ncbi:hypothetical protein KAI04_03790 [Candidatus Pacearchaeota archaeon]|nr:hypothetical protein [Candidatus Pacearchaeota archaeon]
MVQSFKIKKNDTQPVISATLQYNDGTAINLTEATDIHFNLGNLQYEPLTSGACIITGSTTGQIEYRWEGVTDTGSVGTWFGEFQVTFGAGSILTLPNNHDLKIEVFEDYN